MLGEVNRPALESADRHRQESLVNGKFWDACCYMETGQGHRSALRAACPLRPSSSPGQIFSVAQNRLLRWSLRSFSTCVTRAASVCVTIVSADFARSHPLPSARCSRLRASNDAVSHRGSLTSRLASDSSYPQCDALLQLIARLVALGARMSLDVAILPNARDGRCAGPRRRACSREIDGMAACTPD
jgi:hypothetical protein